ncbi:MAG: SBBP repeat-containing protein [Candidatus Korobacteraceae bacterium]|jgi:hypothetical protein
MPSVSAIRAAGLLLLIGALAASVGSHAQSQPSWQAQGKPSLIFSTTLGGLNCNCDNPRTFAQNTGSDAEGNTFVTGASRVTDLPVLHAFQPQPASGASMTAFVAKLDPSGKLLWLTYLGGNNQTMGEGLAVLPDGGVAVDGITNSDDSEPFPTLNAFQNKFAGGGADYFLSVFDKDGNLLYSTYFGGSGTEGSGFVDNNSNGNNLTADAHGLVYLVGTTYSADLPVTANAIQPDLKGDSDAIVAIFDPSKSGADSLIYSSFLGGHDDEKGHGAAVDASGELITAVGYTNSDDFPTTHNAYRRHAPPPGWVSNGFVAQFTSSNPGDPTSEYKFRYSTYLGGNTDHAREDTYGVAVDQNGIIAVTGRTVSPDFPTTWLSVYRSAPYLGLDKSNDQPYMVKIDPSREKKASLIYGTYLGGGAPNEIALAGGGFGTSIGVDSHGNVYLAGETSSYGIEYQDIDGTANLVAPIKYPYTWDALIPAFQGGSQDAMFMQIPPSGAWLAYSTYLGGSGDDRAYGLAVDPDGNVVVTGVTSSPDFPLKNPAQVFPHVPGQQNAFITKFSFGGSANQP